MGKSMFLRKEVGRREDMEAFEFFFFREFDRYAVLRYKVM
jgi:hypothetical protein